MMDLGEYLFSRTKPFSSIDLNDPKVISEAFNERMEEWFFKPINVLKCNDNKYNSNAFAITILECVIIDALAGFRFGLQRNTNGKDFTDFLIKELTIDKKVADKFYKNFRCGILHQAYIKEKGRIVYDEKGILIADDYVKFNPIVFYTQLHEYYSKYIERLKIGDLEVKENFKKHFDYLFSLENFRNKIQQ